MKKGTGKKIAIGTFLGVVTGYITGILTAPKSGKETRQDIKAASAKTLREAEKHLKVLYSELDEAIVKATKKAKEYTSQGQEKLEELVDKAKDAKQKAKDVLSAIRAGDAEDPDLKEAVAKATEAKNKLLDFLKKPIK
ncbi:YtxH domain-containing protein [Candidatus Saccharibacteria bacterium]|jgi:gas vesicle protein|nr:YtxH domain-containing protein [Candidatus Saccharibacteria bacterium]HOR23117.1 YtxH domain-containing protein [Candidatus Saccharibacteria bacterium]HPW47748.1 YtxH domain-containing protein [Candidatus Saccharibacteria bacterium]